jgi:Spy/CpxP family protein refolding chaperone
MYKGKMVLPVIGLLLATLVVSHPVSAYEGGGKGYKKHKQGQMRKHGEGQGIPGLTSEQLVKMQKLKLAHKKEALPLRTKMQAKRLDMETLVLEDADLKKINAKIEQIGKIRIELQKKRMAHRMGVRKLLTEEQRIRFDAKGFGHGHGRKGGFGGRDH